eukprot:4592009-Lingulodinium_polyedra.AAC.1
MAASAMAALSGRCCGPRSFVEGTRTTAREIGTVAVQGARSVARSLEGEGARSVIRKAAEQREHGAA